MNFQTRERQQGITLVELLIGLGLGLLLSAIMGTMYVSSKVSFQTSGEVGRLQENLRFASHYIQRAVREASYTECGNEISIINQLDMTSPDYFLEATGAGIAGWEYAGTGAGDGDFDLAYANVAADATPAQITAARTSNSDAASNWKNQANVNLANAVHELNPLKGSDVLMVAVERKSDVILDASGTTVSPDLGVASGGAEIGFGTILKVGDCRVLDKFQNTSTAPDFISTGTGGITGFVPGNKAVFSADPLKPFSGNWKETAAVFIEEITAFYVGTGASGKPSLFRYTSTCGPSSNSSACTTKSNSELVEGIENMQVLYGEDTDDDLVANIYHSADDVTDFGAVVTIRLSLLLRSNERADAEDKTDFIMVDGMTVKAPELGVIRYLTNMTLHLRNRGV